MVYGMVSIYIYPALYCFRDKTPRDIEQKNSRYKEAAKNMVQWIVIGIGSILIFCYSSLSNETYLAMDMSVNATKSYMTTLITQIKSLDGYEENMAVAFIGINEDSTVTKLADEIFPNIMVGGFQDIDDFAHGTYDIGTFMKLYCGYDVHQLTDTESIVQSAVYKDMGIYHDSNSVKIIDGIVVVKFGESVNIM